MKTLTILFLLTTTLVHAQGPTRDENPMKHQRLLRPGFEGQNFLEKGGNLAPKFSSASATPTHSFSGGIDTAWVRHYGSGLLPAHDRANAIALDASGNIYVTGYSTKAGSKEDYTTIKYNNTGVVQWVARYDGPGNGFDQATALAIDAVGNVYVTGRSEDSDGHSDYATIKYSSAGVEQWIASYDGPENDSDVATALAVDAAGYVYVTGWSLGSGTSYDYATIKYNNAGVEQWVVRYNGPGNNDDTAFAIAVDAMGNVHITGNSYGSGTDDDYATIKYNSAGVVQWVARYNGPGNYIDRASTLAIDTSGNVYVIGTSGGSDTSTDYATIKYNSAGVEQWVARYNGPINAADVATAIAVDAVGNIHVTGYSYGSGTLYDYATIKYNSTGVEQWATRFEGQENSGDIAIALAIDSLGNVYVTGWSSDVNTSNDYVTIKYDISGVEQWIARYNGPGNGSDIASALAIDASGNVYITGRVEDSDGYSDYATIKYNNTGVEQWAARYEGPGNSWDAAYALALDAEGNIYVTGASTASGTNGDYATIKYNSAGAKQWAARYNGPRNDFDTATALVLDTEGNIYVAGYTTDAGINDDYATVKYNNAGIEQWAASYNGPGNDHDEATALAVDAEGNVYVTGHSNNSDRNSDYTTIKYNNAGVEQWAARYNGPGNDTDMATALALDASGNIYVTGSSRNSDGYSDYATIKYSSAGIEQWVARYSGSENSYDDASALVLDGEGNVYVTGRSQGSGTNYDYATIKYNNAGVEQWVARYNGAGNGYDAPSSLALDAGGTVYVTGSSGGAGTFSDYTTIKYNSVGVEQWVARYNGPGNDSDAASALAVDATGNVYVTGYSYHSAINADYATIKYNNAGVEQWIARYNGPGNSSDRPVALAVDAEGNVVVTGSSTSYDSTWRAYTTIKYVQTPVSVDEQEITTPSTYWLSQNYPNPFNPSTMINYQLPVSSHVKLAIYNLMGQEVRTLVQSEMPAGQHSVTWNATDDNGARVATGVYLYVLRAGDPSSGSGQGFVSQKKLILMK